MTTRQLKIKYRTYHFYNDLINGLNFEASNLKLDKKTWKGIDIYFIGYGDKNPDWNVNSGNSLYLILNTVYRYISEKNGNKFLSVDKGDSALKNMIKCLLGLNIILKRLVMKKLILIVTMTRLGFCLMILCLWVSRYVFQHLLL